MYKNTRTIGASMSPNQMFNMELFKPIHIFKNPAYHAAPYNELGTLNCSISGAFDTRLSYPCWICGTELGHNCDKPYRSK